MDLGISNRHALVGASSQGLGFAVADALLAEGVRVTICGRGANSLAQAESELSAKHGEDGVLAVQADLVDPADRQRLLDAATERFGGIDILVLNTGGPPAGNFDAHDQEAWDQTYQLLLGSSVAMARGVLPHMKDQRWGRIIAITSQAVKQPVDGLILSNAVRVSVVGLVKSLANELGEFGITVNSVMPGYTSTKRMQDLFGGGDVSESILAEIPLGRLGRPSEFASVVTFVASESASFVTGASIPVDGGWIRGTL